VIAGTPDLSGERELTRLERQRTFGWRTVEVGSEPSRNGSIDGTSGALEA
jgi:hypothetical protein